MSEVSYPPAGIDESWDSLYNEDWTRDETGRSNSSPEFVRLISVVATLIRNDAHTLLDGRAESTARLIMAQLAHVHGMRPKKEQ